MERVVNLFRSCIGPVYYYPSSCWYDVALLPMRSHLRDHKHCPLLPKNLHLFFLQTWNEDFQSMWYSLPRLYFIVHCNMNHMKLYHFVLDSIIAFLLQGHYHSKKLWFVQGMRWFWKESHILSVQTATYRITTDSSKNDCERIYEYFFFCYTNQFETRSESSFGC